MIPGSAIPTTRLTVDDTVQPVKASAAVTDLLSEFTPGQRLVATIQSQLPNGAYRALIAQREVTLALPFSAKAGDSLELDVVENQGRLTFAVVAKATDGTAGNKESVSATLSQTAQLISTLLPGAKGKELQAPPTRLNGGQALLPEPPKSAAGLPPVLLKAISQSGVFYESHQVAWVNGSLAKAALLAEPQGQLTPLPVLIPSARPGTGQAGGPATGPNPTNTPAAATAVQAPSSQTPASQNIAPAALPSRTNEPPSQAVPQAGLAAATSSIARGTTTAASPMSQPLLPIPAEIAPIVQQQLSALASNVYAWQGIAWPGQKIEWEIVDEDAQRQSHGDPDAPPLWQTRLRLSLPSLGAVDALLTLRGDQVDVALVSKRDDARRTMQQGVPFLREQFLAAGLQLGGMAVKAGEAGETR